MSQTRTLSDVHRTEEIRRIINVLHGNDWVGRAVLMDEMSGRITAATLTDLLGELITARRVAMRSGPYGMRNRKVTQYRLTPVEGKW